MSRRRRVRDIYGNWVTEDQDKSDSDRGTEQSSKEAQEEIHLDWKDFVALSIASLETFLLPVVVFVIVILILAIMFVHF